MMQCSAFQSPTVVPPIDKISLPVQWCEFIIRKVGDGIFITMHVFPGRPIEISVMTNVMLRP